MYVAVKGGERAILNSYRLLDAYRRGDAAVPELTIAQIREQQPLAVSRVMAEGSLYDPDLAALALKQAGGDAIEAIFLLRAYRNTLPRFGYSLPVATAAMRLNRRISATYKDIPGGQVLGPTYDYTQRLLDFSLMDEDNGGARAQTSSPACAPAPRIAAAQAEGDDTPMPRITHLLRQEGLVHMDAVPPGDPAPFDLTRQAPSYPCGRAARLQNLARGDEGYLLALAYSTQRGYGRTHPFVGEIRQGQVEVWIEPGELDFPICIGEIEVTECQMISQFHGGDEEPPAFTLGYGLVFGYSERKAMAMSLVDRSLRAGELGEATDSPANDEEFVLSHSDNVEASGFVQHLKLPHYVDFQSELVLVRQMRADMQRRAPSNDSAESQEAS